MPVVQKLAQQDRHLEVALFGLHAGAGVRSIQSLWACEQSFHAAVNLKLASLKKCRASAHASRIIADHHRDASALLCSGCADMELMALAVIVPRVIAGALTGTLFSLADGGLGLLLVFPAAIMQLALGWYFFGLFYTCIAYLVVVAVIILTAPRTENPKKHGKKFRLRKG